MNFENMRHQQISTNEDFLAYAARVLTWLAGPHLCELRSSTVSEMPVKRPFLIVALVTQLTDVEVCITFKIYL